jgi:hypothetical protein
MLPRGQLSDYHKSDEPPFKEAKIQQKVNPRVSKNGLITIGTKKLSI